MKPMSTTLGQMIQKRCFISLDILSFLYQFCLDVACYNDLLLAPGLFYRRFFAIFLITIYIYDNYKSFQTKMQNNI